ncbi:MAG: M14 family zinc carboxypeptidase [Gammaproteobacteria bacterium]
MASRLTWGALGLALLGVSPLAAEAACQFDNAGTITNPSDPSCRDAQFRYTRDNDTGNNVALGYDVPTPVESLTGVDGYRTYQSLFERHQSLDADNATVDGEILGQTLAGRDIWVYVLGDADRDTTDGGTEAAALINGTIHAREWQSPEAVTEIYEQLVEIQGDAGFGQYLSENLSVLIVPVLNVDGFVQTQGFPDRFTASELQPRDGRMRRKNMQNPVGGQPVDEDIDATTDNFYGVDLNRNSARGWGQNGGSSGNPVSLVFRGPAPESEPEIQALVAAAQIAPAERLRFFSDVHSFSQIFFTPLTGNTRRDNITTSLVARMRAVLGNKYRYGPNSNSGIGLTSDYFARTFQVPAWTLEIEPLNGGSDYGGTNHGHSGFVMPDDQVARMRDEVTSMVLAGLYRQADLPRVQAVEIRDAASGALRYSASWVPDATGRRLQVTTDRALVPGREYRLWLAFNRPMRWRNDGGQIGNYPGQNTAAFPSLSLQFPSLTDAGSDVPINGTGGNWLDVPGGDGNGYLRYRDDALTASFTVPAGTPADSAVTGVLAVATTDIMMAALDGDPSTRADWAGGHWIGYENEAGDETDTGGRDCTITVFVADDENAAAPADRDPGCRTAQAPGPAPPPPDGGGGGGGFALWLLPGLAAAALWRRSRSRPGSRR